MSLKVGLPTRLQLKKLVETDFVKKGLVQLCTMKKGILIENKSDF